MYEHDTSMMLLAHGEIAVLVDLSLCLDPFKATPWLKESLSTLMVIGTLEELEVCYHRLYWTAFTNTSTRRLRIGPPFFLCMRARLKSIFN